MTVRKFAVLSVLIFTLLLCGCGNNAQGTTETTLPAQTAAPTTDTAETTAPATTAEEVLAPAEEYFDPLTGLSVQTPTEKRPVAVVLNNLKEALPQQGNSDAAILYELLAEGGITRLVGIYASLNGVGTLGSIRSARPYFIEVALGHDALFVHAGGSDDAYIKLRDWSVDHMDGVNGGYSSAKAGVFYRDRNRLGGKYATEHSLLSDGERILTAWENSRMRQTLRDGYEVGLTFTDLPLANGEAATTVTVPFSNYKTGVFTYDAESGLYGVEEYGKAFIDGNTGEQIQVKNLLVLQVKYTYSGDSKGHMYADLTRGTGYYAADGKIIPILWEKGDRNTPFRYFTEDGAPLALSRGKSYVCLQPTSQKVSFR